MYIPILKNRQQENKLLREHSNLFNKEIFPLIEIFTLEHQGKNHSIEEVINSYDETIRSSYFMDFFTFDSNDYEPFDKNNAKFALDIRTNTGEYKYFDDLLSKTSLSSFAIPVVSINKIREEWLDINDIILKLQNIKPSISVRIEGKLFDRHFKTINKILREQDYLFFDIGQSNPDPYVLQIERLIREKGNYKSIIFHSPRTRSVHNNDLSLFIDNDLLLSYEKLGFDGVGDYLGLKDELPNDPGRGGKALSLLFNYKDNSFISYVAKSDSIGFEGFEEVLDQVLEDEIKLNPGGDCLAFKYIHADLVSRGLNGSWAQWKYITMLRYISEVSKHY